MCSDVQLVRGRDEILRVLSLVSANGDAPSVVLLLLFEHWQSRIAPGLSICVCHHRCYEQTVAVLYQHVAQRLKVRLLAIAFSERLHPIL